MEQLFEHESIPKAYFSLALPVVLGMVASMVYNLADTFFIAQTQITALVAGVALCTPLFSLLLALGDIFGLGGSSLISRLLGAHDHNTGRRVSSWCFYAAIALGILTTIILLSFERPIIGLLGATSATYHYAASFYHVMVFGAPIIILSLVPSNLIRTEGFAKASMIGTVAGTVVTIILDPLLIFPLGMGAAGAALATVIGYGVTDVLLIYATLKSCEVISVDWHVARLSWTLVGQVILIGIPASLTNLMQAFGTTVLNRYLDGFGPAAVAAMGIVLKVYMIVILVMVGFAFGAQPLIGYSYGGKHIARFKKIIHFDLLVECGYSILVAALLMFFAPHIISLFMHDREVIRIGQQLLRAFLTTTPFVGAVLVYTTVFQSIGKAGSALIMAIARQGVIFYLAITIMAALFKLNGIVWAQPVADVLTCAIGFLLYHRALRVNTSAQR